MEPIQILPTTPQPFATNGIQARIEFDIKFEPSNRPYRFGFAPANAAGH
ncbi:MAG: hypothetical protein IPN94_09130 [Sphingobacteriales bacterium]|nr:hypothetical protein [Sphingobacteriales bacterium]